MLVITRPKLATYNYSCGPKYINGVKISLANGIIVGPDQHFGLNPKKMQFYSC
jgi:hypothetical protein